MGQYNLIRLLNYDRKYKSLLNIKTEYVLYTLSFKTWLVTDFASDKGIPGVLAC